MLQIQNTKINNQEINAVSARELHANLELRTEFTNWTKQFLGDFIQDIDFVRNEGKLNPTNNVPLIDYLFTLDMAKQIAMLTRTAKGKEIRLYFIECEKKLKQQPIKVPTNFIEAMTLALEQAKLLEQQTLLLEEQKPQVEFANAVANTCDSITIGGYAGLLASSGYDIGQNRLFTWLRDNGYLTTRNNRPSIAAIKAGWLKWIENTYVCPKTGLPKVSGQALITGKGQIYLRKKLIKEFGVK
jgi:anti-repressor protein